jgi:omega-amidase
MQDLIVSLIQSDIIWENKTQNCNHFGNIIASLPAHAQVVVLPEMFNTGFSMQPDLWAEDNDGPTIQWMKEMAIQYRKIIVGSIIVENNNHYYNRLIWMQPNGQYFHYDKRHLFGFAGEDQHYTAGEKKIIVQVNGWKICLQVCYDLRFPVWTRQSNPMQQTNPSYDILLYVANWPERRIHAWKTLLMARAIENQCYVIGVNRIGNDGNNIYYSGDSALINPMGAPIWAAAHEATVYTHTLHYNDLLHIRTQFPFLKDGDAFMLL